MEEARWQKTLLGWYDRHRRRLPWRDHPDPYAVLVSEFMLQQTQASRVVERFGPFLRRFPDMTTLSAAGPGAVIEEWRGLGYNRRAVALHRTAGRILADHGGRVPSERSALESLPGIGPYTARAIAAFAFSQRTAPVDVNIARVLTRAVAGHPLTRGALQALADDQVAKEQFAATRPGAWSQALMDLGATACRPRLPVCATCPIVAHCTWQRDTGHAASTPGGDAPGQDRTTPSADDPAQLLGKPARRQAPFEGSDRQRRGMLVDAARRGPVPFRAVPAMMGLHETPQRAYHLARGLVADGLIVRRGDQIRLPSQPDGLGVPGRRAGV